MLDDMEIVLTREEHKRMLRDVLLLVTGLVGDLDSRHAIAVTKSMGINNLAKTFAPTIADLQDDIR